MAKQLRFSEAMMLGSLSLTPIEGCRGVTGGHSGCAIGMAEYAVGRFARWCAAESEWAWLSKAYGYATYPCGCCLALPASSILTVIAQTFNNHVMGNRTWTIDRLAQWVDSIDPTPRDEQSESVTEPQELPAHDDAIAPEWVPNIGQCHDMPLKDEDVVREGVQQ